MKRITFLLGVFALLVVAGAGQMASGQYLVSTKAGFVNRAEGMIYIQRAENDSGERGRASLGTQMKEGDLLITAIGARAEILLNPGSYLRLNESTEVRAVGTSLTQPRFEVVKGSVIVEIGQLAKQTAIEILTPQGPISMGKEGLQRIDVTAGGTTVAVRQGEAYLGTAEQLLAKRAPKVGRGKMARLVGTTSFAEGTQPQLAKVDKDAVDQFDSWSFNRAQTLMAANYSALRRSSLSSAFALGWYFDPFYNCYTFIPGGGLYFSPYGFPFFRRYSDFSYYFPYGYGYGYYPGGGSWGGSGGGGGSVPARVIAGHDRVPAQRQMEGRGLSTGNSGYSGADAPTRGVSMGSSSAGTVSAPSAPVSVSGGASRGDSGGSSSAGRPSRP